MVRHKNQYGYWENLDSLPVRDCTCSACRRARRGERAGAIAEAVVIGGLTLGGAVANPQQNSSDTQSNWADSTAYQERDRRSEDIDRETRAANERHHGTSEQS